jgi:hypothetical protein
LTAQGPKQPQRMLTRPINYHAPWMVFTHAHHDHLLNQSKKYYRVHFWKLPHRMFMLELSRIRWETYLTYHRQKIKPAQECRAGEAGA